MATFEVKRILVPVDFSTTGEKVLNHAALLAKKTKAELVLMSVIEGPMGNAGSSDFGISLYNRTKFESMLADGVKKNLEKYKASLLKKGAAKVSYLIESGKPYKKITEAAKKIKADVIFMGTHGVSGMREFVIGSNTFRVVSEASCPILSVQKTTLKTGFKHILLPFRDKAHSRESVEYAIRMAELYGAIIHVLGISLDTSDEGVNKILLEGEQIKQILTKRGVKSTLDIVKGNYVAKLINAFAKKKKADLLVIMSDLDRMSISELVIGPVVQQLINHSKIPVLSIQPVINPKKVVGSGDWTFWA